MRKKFVETILESSQNNQTPYVLTGDLGYSVLEPFRDKFPDHFLM